MTKYSEKSKSLALHLQIALSLWTLSRHLLFPHHWGCTICSQADSAGPVHSDRVQRTDDSGENISCCRICHQHHLHELHELYELYVKVESCHIYRHEDSHNGDEIIFFQHCNVLWTHHNIQLSHSLSWINRRMTIFLGTVWTLRSFFSFYEAYWGNKGDKAHNDKSRSWNK